MIHNWASGWFGKQVQASILGRLKSKLVRHPRVCVINRGCATTQLCPACGAMNKHALDQRMYHCSCGYTMDRDVHSAKNMLIFGMDEHNIVKSPGVGRASTPVERKASAMESSGPGQASAMKQETTTSTGAKPVGGGSSPVDARCGGIRLRESVPQIGVPLSSSGASIRLLRVKSPSLSSRTPLWATSPRYRRYRYRRTL